MDDYQEKFNGTYSPVFFFLLELSNAPFSNPCCIDSRIQVSVSSRHRVLGANACITLKLIRWEWKTCLHCHCSAEKCENNVYF